MWVHCPMNQRLPGDKECPPEIVLTWGRKLITLRQGINEIPETVAQAFFLFGLPEELESDEKLYGEQIQVALRRWARAMKSPPPDIDFLKTFDVAETREGLELILSERKEANSQDN